MSLSMQVHIDEEAYQKIMHWVRKANNYEVSGLGTVVYDKENHVMRVTDAFLLKQENTQSTTDIDEHSIGELEYEVHKSQSPGELRFWWHSHCNMKVFWSGTDMSTIEQLGNGGWFLSTVFNLKEEMRSCIYITDPMKVFHDELPTTIISKISTDDLELALESIGVKAVSNIENLFEHIESKICPSLIKQWDDQYDEKVIIKSPVVYSGNFKYGNGGYYNNNYNYINNQATAKNDNVSYFDKKNVNKNETKSGIGTDSDYVSFDRVFDSFDDDDDFSGVESMLNSSSSWYDAEFEKEEAKDDILQMIGTIPGTTHDHMNRHEIVRMLQDALKIHYPLLNISNLIKEMEDDNQITFSK